MTGAEIRTPEVRRPRGRRVVLIVVGAFVVMVLAAWFFVVPRLVRGAITASLQDAGVARVEIGAVSIGTSRARVADVRLFGTDPDAGELTIAVVTSEFALADLFARRIDTLVVEGLSWTRSASPGRAASPFDAASRPGANGDSEVDAIAAGLPELPVRRMIVRDATIATRAAPDGEPMRGELTFDASGAVWRVEAKVAAFDHALTIVADAGADGTALVGALEVRSTGLSEVSLDGTWRYERSVERFDLRFDDASVAMNGVQMHGIAAELQLFGAPLPVSHDVQLVRWRDLTAGAIAAGAGEASFEFGEEPEVRLQVTQHTIDGAGSIVVRDLRWTPAENTFPLAIDVHDVPLREWIELASQGRVTGDGRLNGDLALAVAIEPRFALDLRGGKLSAVPGGVVRFLDHPDTDVIIREHVQQIAAASGHDSVVQERLVAALKEFRYSALDFVFERDPAKNDVTLRVHLAGEGAKVPQQVNLDVNLHGVDAALDSALAIKLGLDRAKERLDRKIETPPDGPPKEKKP